MATKPRAVSAAIEPMTTEALRERLTLLVSMGVSRAAFYGPHLTEVEFRAVVVEEPPGEAAQEDDGGELDALGRLAQRGEKRLNRES